MIEHVQAKKRMNNGNKKVESEVKAMINKYVKETLQRHKDLKTRWEECALELRELAKIETEYAKMDKMRKEII